MPETPQARYSRRTNPNISDSLSRLLHNLFHTFSSRASNIHSQIRLLKNSGMFDADWYLKHNPDVADNGMDPAEHYLRYGADEGRDPGPHFDTRYYRLYNPDVSVAGMNPLVHYLRWGRREGRLPMDNNMLAGDMDRIRQSGLFDADWYLHQYPDLALSGMDPLEHYLHHGAGENRNPGPAFNTRYYLEDNPDVADAGINPLLHYVKWGRDKGREAPSDILAGDLEEKLWGGFSRYAVPELETVKRKQSLPSRERELAAWHLVRWYYFNGDYRQALENIRHSRRAQQSDHLKTCVAEAQCLAQLGRYDEANRSVDLGIGIHGSRRDFFLLKALIIPRLMLEQGSSSEDADRVRLDWLNRAFTSQELAPLARKDATRPLAFDNIRAAAEPAIENQKEKVSVIMPAFNAVETIRIALDSLLAQTWRNLEIIVVDDCSSDGTAAIVEKLAASDNRIRLIRKSVNEGAYPARNTALQHAGGDLIMVHDSDDWSHPQKIELQVAALREQGDDIVAVMSHWIRFDDNLDLIGPWIQRGDFADLNFSSLMMRRRVVDDVGEWHRVRASGDTEYRFRIQRFYGQSSIIKISPEKILSLSLSRHDSLTRASDTHMRTLYSGIRWQYRDTYLYWHSREAFRRDPRRHSKIMPVPVGLRSDNKDKGDYDIVVIADFAARGPALATALETLMAARENEMRTGAFHWRRYGPRVQSPLDPRLYETCHDYGIDLLASSIPVKTDTAFVCGPAMLQHMPDSTPVITANRLAVLVDEPAEPSAPNRDRTYNPRTVFNHLLELFGQEGCWAAASAPLLTLLQSDPRYPATGRMWRPMLDVSGAQAPQWRGGSGTAPAIGGHLTEDEQRITGTPEFLQSVYGADPGWRVRLFADTPLPRIIAARLPENFRLIRHDDVDGTAYLSGLDIYLYQPRETDLSAPRRGILEAMVAGVPVLLPPQLRQEYGDAAVYAERDRLAESVSLLWNDREGYLQQAEAGLKFVDRHCNMADFQKRLATLFSESIVTEKSKV